jgi:hypothetical protein
MGGLLELSNGVVYIKCTPMQFLASEIIILHYSRKENKADACKGVGIWPFIRLNLLSPMQFKVLRLTLVSGV